MLEYLPAQEECGKSPGQTCLAPAPQAVPLVNGCCQTRWCRAPGLETQASHSKTKTKQYLTLMPADRDMRAYTKQILNHSLKHKKDFS